MTAIFRLVQGRHKIEFADGTTYAVETDFRPPATPYSYNLAGGTSLNRDQGEILEGERAGDVTMQFTVVIRGSSIGEITEARERFNRFLRRYSPKDQSIYGPMYFDYQPVEGVPEPLNGQIGAFARYHVVTTSTELTDDFGTYERSSYIRIRVSLRARPYTIGKPQRLLKAKGAIIPSLIGSTDGTPRGWRVSYAMTNHNVNPVFGNPTWNYGYTAAGTMKVQQNTDPIYTYPGSTSSALLAAQSLTNSLVVSANIGTTAIGGACMMAVVKRPPSGRAPEISATDIRLIYEATPGNMVDADSQQYIDIGDGFYVVTGLVTGDGSAQDFGVRLVTASLYLCALAIYDSWPHEGILPVVTGDLLGASWSGTRHQSTSATLAGGLSQVVTQQTFNSYTGAIFLSFRTDIASADLSGNTYLFQCDPNLSIYYDSAAAAFKITDGATTVTVLREFAINEAINLLAVWDAAGLRLYVSEATENGDPSYRPFDGTAYYIGSDASFANKFPCMFRDVCIWGQTINNATSKALINSLVLTSSDRPVSPILFGHTRDGDNVLDNCLDGTRQNCMVIGGITGDVSPLVEIYARPNTTTLSYWVLTSPIPYGEHVQPGNQWYYDDYAPVTTTTTADSNSTVCNITSANAYVTLNPTLPWHLQGNVYWFARLSSASTGWYLAPAYSYSAALTSTFNGDNRPITTDATRRWYLAGSMNLEIPALGTERGDRPSHQLRLRLYRPSGSATVALDFVMLIAGSVTLVTTEYVDLTAPGGYLYVTNNDASSLATQTRGMLDHANWSYNPIDLKPNQYNYLFWVTAVDGGAHTVTTTANLAETYITPRRSMA